MAHLPLNHAGHVSEALHETRSGGCSLCPSACPLGLIRLLLGPCTPPRLSTASTLGSGPLGTALLATLCAGFRRRGCLLSCVANLGACLGCSVFEVLSISLHLRLPQNIQLKTRQAMFATCRLCVIRKRWVSAIQATHGSEAPHPLRHSAKAFLHARRYLHHRQPHIPGDGRTGISAS